MIVCIAEDRKGYETPLKLLILSLTRHSPQLPIYLIYPPAGPAFTAWLKAYPQVELCIRPLENAYGWNVKPQALLYLMDAGHEDVVWIDSDIIVTKDILGLFKKTDDRTLFITEEALWGLHYDAGNLRAELWGFPFGRALPFTLNTSVMRATKNHRSLLDRWQKILESEEYRRVQQMNWKDRPVHMVGDQDVLTALLASNLFSDIPLRILRRGKDILQYFGLFGFTVSERARNLLRGAPTFVHSQGAKPWAPISSDRPIRSVKAYIEAVYLDLSPYTCIAKRYRDELQEDTAWMLSHSVLGQIMRGAGLGYPPLVGLPLAIVADCFRARKCVGRFFRRGT